jgi:DNA-binding NtrC family response regulator
MPTVLLVEDDAALRYAAERHLIAAGISVVAVATTMAALKVLAEQSAQAVDVLVTDIVMPEGNPHGIALALMAKRRLPKLQVIYVTGYRDVVDALGHPLDAPMLAKPLDLNVLCAEIHRLTSR